MINYLKKFKFISVLLLVIISVVDLKASNSKNYHKEKYNQGNSQSYQEKKSKQSTSEIDQITKENSQLVKDSLGNVLSSFGIYELEDENNDKKKVKLYIGEGFSSNKQIRQLLKYNYADATNLDNIILSPQIGFSIRLTKRFFFGLEGKINKSNYKNFSTSKEIDNSTGSHEYTNTITDSLIKRVSSTYDYYFFKSQQLEMFAHGAIGFSTSSIHSSVSHTWNTEDSQGTDQYLAITRVTQMPTSVGFGVDFLIFDSNREDQFWFNTRATYNHLKTFKATANSYNGEKSNLPTSNSSYYEIFTGLEFRF